MTSQRPSAFSVYASQFINNATTALNRSIIGQPPSETTEPLFFSVTEGSHLGDDDPLPAGTGYSDDDEDLRQSMHQSHHSEVGDDGLPRLDGSREAGLAQLQRSDNGYSDNGHHPPRIRRESDDDPYLDEEDLEDVLPGNIDSMPLIASRALSPRPDAAPKQGWLAHFSTSRGHSPLNPPSPDYSSSPPLSRRTSESSDPPDEYFTGLPSARDNRSNRLVVSPPPTRTTLSESLLPRDGVSRSVFVLPEHGDIPRRKYNDYPWTAIWCASLLICGLGSIITLFIDPSPSTSNPDKPPTPYFTITHAVPLLMLVTILSSGISYLHLVLLRFAVGPVLIGTAVSIPVALFIGAAWSFAGSFFYDDGKPSTWGETVGLRLFSLLPLVFAFFSARSLFYRQQSLLRTVKVVELSTSIVLQNLPILGLSLCLLFGSLFASIPFLSLILRLTLIGYYDEGSKNGSGSTYHIRGYAGWLAFLATVVWIWSWGVVRGMLKVTVSGVVGNWYFTQGQHMEGQRTPLDVTQASFRRASGPSLGSICVSTLALTFTSTSIFVLRTIRRLTTPAALQFLAPLHPLEVISSLIAILDSLGSYTLVYIGLTGERFWVSGKKSRELVHSNGRGGRGKGSRASEYTLLSYLLLLSSLSVSLVAAIGGFLFAAHTLSGPTNAPLMALLTGCVTFLTVRFGVGVGEDAADTLFMCYKIETSTGQVHSQDILDAFEGKKPQSQV